MSNLAYLVQDEDQERTFHYGQTHLLFDTQFRDHLVLGGVGYGKTTFGPAWWLERWRMNPRCPESLICAPTQKLVKRCFEQLVRYLKSIGMREGKGYDFRWNRSMGDMYLEMPNGHKVHGVSADNAEGLMSWDVGWIWADEMSVYDEEFVRRMYQRLRNPNVFKRQLLGTTTPEGTNHLYDRFGEEVCTKVEGTPWSVGKNKLVLHGSSHDNPYLDEEFLQTLWDEFGWDAIYYANYVLAQWVSLSRDRFYFAFNPRTHVGDFPFMPMIRQFVLTFDFNVGIMSCAVLQKVGLEYWVVWENGSNGRNTADACEQFVKAFPPAQYRHFNIAVFGDASGWKRSDQTYTNSYDIIESILKPKYPLLHIEAHRGNPFVEERSRCTNHLFAVDRLRIDKSCRKTIMSAKTAETDARGKIKKPPGEKVTHPMEAVDMALICLEPPTVRFEPSGVTFS